MATKTSSKICFITNLAPHYRKAIFTLMDRELDCDFYIGNRVHTSIEKMNYTDLSGFKRVLIYIPLVGKLYWQKGVLGLPFRPYRSYLMTGELHCLSSWYILLMVRLLGKRSVLWSHGWYGDETQSKKRVKKLFFGLAGKVLLYGDHARNIMISEGFDPDKLVCIYNSLDFDNQVKIRSALHHTTIYQDHFSNTNPILLYIGRIQKEKKLDLLIDALNSLNKNGTKCNLVLIGEEVEQTGIRQLVSEKDLDDQVWFVGPLFLESRLGEFIYNADVCVSPGNVGLTAIHCLTYGTPVITHDNFTNQGPEFEAIRNDITGSFFNENSLEDLCLKIRLWISLSKEKRETTRKECYATIEKNYNPHSQIKVLKNLVTD